MVLTIEYASVNVYKKKLRQLRLLFARLTEVYNYHIAYYKLKKYLSIPNLVLLLRKSSTWIHKDKIDEMNECIESTVERLSNSKSFLLDLFCLILTDISADWSVSRIISTPLPQGYVYISTSKDRMACFYDYIAFITKKVRLNAQIHKSQLSWHYM